MARAKKVETAKVSLRDNASNASSIYVRVGNYSAQVTANEPVDLPKDVIKALSEVTFYKAGSVDAKTKKVTPSSWAKRFAITHESIEQAASAGTSTLPGL